MSDIDKVILGMMKILADTRSEDNETLCTLISDKVQLDCQGVSCGTCGFNNKVTANTLEAVRTRLTVNNLCVDE